MSPFPLEAFLASLPWAALGVVLVLAVTYAVAVSAQAVSAVAVGQARHSVMDVAWGPGFVVIAVIAFVLSAGEGDGGRRVLLLGPDGPLGNPPWHVHVGRRARGGHEDPRYVDAAEGGTRVPERLRHPARLPAAGRGDVLRVADHPGGHVRHRSAGVARGRGFGSMADRIHLRIGGRPAAGAVQKRSRTAGHGPEHRAVALHAPPQLLWRRRRLGRAVPRRGRVLARRADRPLPGTDDLDAGRQDREAAHRESHAGRPGYREYVQSTSGFIPWPPRRH